MPFMISPWTPAFWTFAIGCSIEPAWAWTFLAWPCISCFSGIRSTAVMLKWDVGIGPVCLRADPINTLSVRICHSNTVTFFPIPSPRSCRPKNKSFSNCYCLWISSVSWSCYDCRIEIIAAYIHCFKINVPVHVFWKRTAQLGKSADTQKH